MNRVRLFFVLALLAAVVGCSTPSPFVGEWKSEALPDKFVIPAEYSRVTVAADQTITSEFVQSDGQVLRSLGGTWYQVDIDTMDIHFVEGVHSEGGVSVSAKLVKPDTVLVDQFGVSIKLQRVTE